MSEIDAVIRRIRKRMYLLGALEIAGAFAFGWRAGVSLTIAAAVVIFSFLAFEKVTERLGPQDGDVPGDGPRGRFLTIAPLLLITIASLVLFGIVLFRWKSFEPVAGAVGLSTVVLAILPEAVLGGAGKN
jgi:hypothetical protein